MRRKDTIASRITPEGITREDNGTFGTQWDYWATLLPGWISPSDPKGHLSTIHEPTRRDVERAIMAAIPCGCPECSSRLPAQRPRPMPSGTADRTLRLPESMSRDADSKQSRTGTALAGLSANHKDGNAMTGPRLKRQRITESDIREGAKQVGLFVGTWSPGDGATRYRFFETAGNTYFGPANGIFTALGAKEAATFLAGRGAWI